VLCKDGFIFYFDYHWNFSDVVTLSSVSHDWLEASDRLNEMSQIDINLRHCRVFEEIYLKEISYYKSITQDGSINLFQEMFDEIFV